MYTTALFRTLLLICCLAASPLWATQSREFGILFDDTTLLELTIEADFVAFLADRGGRPSYHDATVRYQADGEEVSIPAEIRVRGRFRRDPLTCDFPPVRLKFNKHAELPPLFEGQRKLKLVTHCKEEAYIFREYYLYKAYNLLTEQSFRVRMARVTYRDINGAREEEIRYAFIIESEEEMAQRNGGDPLDDDVSMHPGTVNEAGLTRVHMFNYMVANKDFDITIRQNVKIITQPEGMPVVIPYDFDWAGIVDASYTKVGSAKNEEAYFTRRRFMPLCRTEAQYEATIQEFEAIRPALTQLYERSPYLSAADQKQALAYFANFYKTIRKKKTMKKVFRQACNS